MQKMAKWEQSRYKQRIWCEQGGVDALLYSRIDLALIEYRYIQKFYQMRTQLQAISLRIQVRHCRLLEYLSLNHVTDGSEQ